MLFRAATVFSLLFLLPVLLAMPAAAQTGTKTLYYYSSPNEPLSLVSLKVEGTEQKLNSTFTASQDWVRHFELTVKNVTSNTIQFIELGVYVPHRTAEDSEFLVQYILTGSTVAPNATVVLNATTSEPVPDDYDVTRARFEIANVIFSNGALWRLGTIFQQTSPGVWGSNGQARHHAQGSPFVNVALVKRCTDRHLSSRSIICGNCSLIDDTVVITDIPTNANCIPKSVLVSRRECGRVCSVTRAESNCSTPNTE